MISLLVITGCEKPASTTESPDKVLLKMQEQYQEKKSENKKSQTKGSFTFKVNTAKTNISTFGELDITIDGIDINNPKAEIISSLEGESSGEEIEGSAKIDLNLKLFKQTLYLKLNELELNSKDDPNMTQQIQMMSAFITNKWFKIPLPENQGLNPVGISGPLSLNNSQFTEEQIKQIEDLAKTIPVFKFAGDLGLKNGKYNYKVTLHKENIIRFIGEMAKIMNTELTNEDQDKIKEILQTIEIKAEFVIDAKTFELNEIKNGEIFIKSSENNEEATMVVNAKLSQKKTEINFDIVISVNGEEIKINATLDLNTIPNAKINIEEPEEAEEFDPLMMMGLSSEQGVPELAE